MALPEYEYKTIIFTKNDANFKSSLSGKEGFEVPLWEENQQIIFGLLQPYFDAGWELANPIGPNSIQAQHKSTPLMNSTEGCLINIALAIFTLGAWLAVILFLIIFSSQEIATVTIPLRRKL